jgi:short-subunit dehydrogenase
MNVVITGASRGIGYAIASVFAGRGHSLFLISKNDIALYKAVEKLQHEFPGISIKSMPYDLSKKEEAVACGHWVLDTAGSADVLINNAGFFEPGNVIDESDGVLESQLATNVYSAYHLTRVLVKPMIKKRSGHIFNMCSIASLAAYPGGGSYSISKYALHGFSANLRNELKPFLVKVTSVFPGAVLTDSWEGFDNSKNRIMIAEDVAQMIYTASQLSPAACVEDIVMRPVQGDL